MQPRVATDSRKRFVFEIMSRKSQRWLLSRAQLQYERTLVKWGE